MSSLWLSLEPLATEVRLSLSRASSGLVLRARLPSPPAQPQSLMLFLEALVAWHGEPLCAVLDADAEDVRRRPEFWTRFLGDADSPNIAVEWVTLPATSHRRDRFLGPLGASRRAKRLLSFSSSGQR